jgi:aspartate/methionine/tyrosine aminotransferase
MLPTEEAQLKYVRMPIEVESPEERGYSTIRYNLSESSVTDRALAEFRPALDSLVLAYCEHRGLTTLRQRIAGQSAVAVDDVLVTAGAAGALFIVATTLLSPHEHLVVVRPNYATNIETPRAIGCGIDFVDLAFEDGFRIDPDRVRAALRPQTKLISITTPHNPTGACLDRAGLDRIVRLAEDAGCHLLVDETYRDMSFGEKLPVAATLSPCAISVSSVSKSYGIPGVRVGWLISRDAALMERLLAAKEQIGICGGIIDETVAEAALAARDVWLPATHARLQVARSVVADWIDKEPALEWIEPDGGCVCFPRIRREAQVDVARFYAELDARAVAVGPGHWFEMDRRFMRVGFGFPDENELRGGLAAISAALRAATA